MKNLVLFFKSHIDTFTRKNGSVVAAHDDKRTKQPDMFGGDGDQKKTRSKGYAAGKKFVDGVVADYDAGKSHPRHNATMARAHLSDHKIKSGMSDSDYSELTSHFNSHAERAAKENKYDSNPDGSGYKREKWAA